MARSTLVRFLASMQHALQRCTTYLWICLCGSSIMPPQLSSVVTLYWISTKRHTGSPLVNTRAHLTWGLSRTTQFGPHRPV
ncbi:hypothetical protein BD311DRAFT_770448 [Dichomitus squalens]|uniref:Uncharacterized protein n=1 Tax=Dichomitus squalens TaxID=114155 RepID=A0A4Q9M8Z4_9APHY|nr:hypothetical protein BD311DRAFT_770448 [Dichomitus squalens]